MSSADEGEELATLEEDLLWTPPPGIHDPYELVQSLPLGEFNNRAGSLGFDPRWCCRGARTSWRACPTYSNCPHFCTLTTTSKLKIMSNDHCGFRPSDNFRVDYNKLNSLSDSMDTCTPVVLKYLISSDQKYILVLFQAKDDLSHVGVVFDVSNNNNILGYYTVSDCAQFQVRFVRQLLLGASEDIFALVVEKQYCDRTAFTRQTFEVWSFHRNKNHSTKFDMLNVHNSLEAAMRFHGPLFTSVPGHGVDLYCVAFFKDSYRLKNLYGTYFIALIDMLKNRYLRVVGPDDAGLRQIDAALHEVHFHHMEPSTCGTYLAVSIERLPGFHIQVLLLDTASLRLIHAIQVPLFIGPGEGLLTATCSSNARVTFSKCSTRMSIFYLQNQGQQLGETPSVQIYQLPVVISLASLCKFQLLRSLPKVTIAQLPLPDVLRRFVLGANLPPAEEEYIETNSGLRIR